jgi:hypothetical protein
MKDYTRYTLLISFLLWGILGIYDVSVANLLTRGIIELTISGFIVILYLFYYALAKVFGYPFEFRTVVMGKIPKLKIKKLNESDLVADKIEYASAIQEYVDEYQRATLGSLKSWFPKSVKDLNLAYIKYLLNNEMKKGVTEKVTAEIFFNKSFLGDREQQSQIELIYIAKRVTAKLIADDKFEIKSLSSETQVVLDDDKTIWNWDVKPVKSGVGSLSLVVTALIQNEGNGFETKDVETLRKEIKVKVNHNYTFKTFLKTNWQWLVGLLFGSGVIIAVLKALGLIK